ncbi:erythromycin esterase family protein [Hymenobacter volaticus]|uniref:erythromycin esterase family protein n=1 Tax=Hymenobacter volaticus TaxID=2932254 RepID=UPI002468EA9C|nr:erythromycin esterase family protein [Hymenobacter volaticus]
MCQTLDSQLRINYRSACLAENVQWARAQANGSRVVVWANNAQLSMYNRDYQPLGEFLRRQYGAGYVNVGFAFHEGSFRALRPADPPAFFTAVAVPSVAGSYEQYFHAAGLPARPPCSTSAAPTFCLAPNGFMRICCSVTAPLNLTPNRLAATVSAANSTRCCTCPNPLRHRAYGRLD